MVQRVAIVGAGVSGLASIKCCLDEGLEPTCFESAEGLGGLWRFAEIPEKGRTSVYSSVISNSSKEITCFSDFPFPEDCPNYLRHSVLLDYFKAYAKQFHLLDHIHFKTTVFSIRKHPDFTATGQWVVCTETEGQQASAIFDAVMVCNGLYAEINLPLASFPGIEKFEGRYFHSWEYRDPKGFEGKNVLVIGAGNTGGDVVVEISRAAAKVFLSTRHGTWVLSRIGKTGWPVDMFHTRFLGSILKLIPESFQSRIVPKIMNRWFNHENYGLVPIQSSWIPLMVNDELPSCLLCGGVVVKPNVKRFTETSVIFEDGTVGENIDVVIFATGYNAAFPYLEESVGEVCRNRTSLYKQVFLPSLEKPTLAVIGCISVIGSMMPVVELQARWVTRVFNGSSKLPPENRLVSEVAKQKEDLLKSNLPSNKARLVAVAYMDEIADCIGVKPNMPLLFLLDPKLALSVLFGPFTSYQYRLTGPGKWEKARSLILTLWDRVLKPLKTRVIDDSPKHSMAPSWVKILGLSTFLGAAVLFFKCSSPSWVSG